MIESRISQETEILHPDEMLKLRAAFPEFVAVPDWMLQHAYQMFSDTHSAGWLTIGDDLIPTFRYWLEHGDLPGDYEVR